MTATDVRGLTFAVSPAQRRLWFLDRLTPGRALYSIHNAVQLGDMSPRLVQAAVDHLVSRHESLRTTFDEKDGEPVQLVRERLVVPVRLVDLLPAPASHRQAMAISLAAQESAQPFDLTSGPLFRITLVRINQHEHLLLLTIHHIIADGWSMSVFFRDFAACYEALALGQPLALPTLQIQYADFAAWQNQQLTNIDPRHVAYWRTTLAELPALELPTDRARAAVPSFSGSAHRFRLTDLLVARLDRLARAEGSTLFMALLAGFFVTLADYTGQEDLVVGVPTSGRDRSELEPLIGFFVNMLVIRTSIHREESFRQLLRQVRGAMLDALSHQEVPFDRVVEELRQPRDLSRHPLFQVAFQLHQRPDAADSVSRAFDASPAEIPRTNSNFDLHLELWREAGALNGRVTFATDLFDAETVKLQAAHFLRVLQAFAADPDLALSGLDTTGEAERRRVLALGVGTGRYRRDVSVSSLVEAAADQQPNAVAVRAEKVQLTYAELDRLANGVANGLLRRGLRPQEPVGVLAQRSASLVVVLLGVLKAGGCYVGIEPDEPPERIRELLARAGSRFLFSVAGGSDRLPSEGFGDDEVTVLPVDGEDAFQRKEPLTRPNVRVEPGHLAYISFTSGSTGIPKGVGVTHRGVVRLVTGTSFRTISSNETFLLLSPIAFDASTMEVWGPLTHGARLVVHPAGPFSLASLGRLVQAADVTTLFLTAGLFHQFVDEELPRLASVSTVISGGDVLSAAHIRNVLRLPGRRTVINAYGPTENAAYTTCHVMTDPATVPDRVPIGRPISGTTVYVLDASMRPVPVGVPGELWTGGDGLAVGYVGDGEATRAAFIDGPFEYVPAERLYRTGDRARWRHDGTAEFLGRLDRQVKVRGFRVEPGEVEAALLALPDIRDAAVLVAGETPDDRRLVAFVVTAEDGAVLAVDEVKARLAQRLPRYLLPSTLQQVPRLPLLRNGKLDRNALLQELTEPGAPTGERVAPRSDFEAALVPIWAHILSVKDVSVTADFFADLGGHSLLGTRLVARVRDAFDIDLPLRALFDSPTIAGMALAVESLILDEVQRGGAAMDLARPSGGDR